ILPDLVGDPSSDSSQRATTAMMKIVHPRIPGKRFVFPVLRWQSCHSKTVRLKRQALAAEGAEGRRYAEKERVPPRTSAPPRPLRFTFVSCGLRYKHVQSRIWNRK